MTTITNAVIRLAVPGNESCGLECTRTDYQENLDGAITKIFGVTVKDLKIQENLIKKSRGFFWDKIVRLIFGYKFDILIEEKKVSEADRQAFGAAVAKIKYETSSEPDLLKTLKVSEAIFKNHQSKLDQIKSELKGDLSVEDKVFDKSFEAFLKKRAMGENSPEAFQKLLKMDKKKFKEDFIEFFIKGEFDKIKGELKDDLIGELNRKCPLENKVVDKAFEAFLRKQGGGESSLARFQKLLNPGKDSFKADFKKDYFNRVIIQKSGFEPIEIDKEKSDQAYLLDARRSGKLGFGTFIKLNDDDTMGQIVEKLSELSEKELEKLELSEKVKVGETLGPLPKEVELAMDKVDKEIISKCSANLRELKGKLEKLFIVKKIDEKNKEAFKNLIFKLLSHSGAGELSMSMNEDIFGDPLEYHALWQTNGFNPERSDLDMDLEIVDKTTIKLKIKAKDPELKLSAEKVITSGSKTTNEPISFQVKNPESETLFKLNDKGIWIVVSSKVSFQIVNKAKAAKEA